MSSSRIYGIEMIGHIGQGVYYIRTLNGHGAKREKRHMNTVDKPIQRTDEEKEIPQTLPFFREIKTLISKKTTQHKTAIAIKR